MKQGTSPASTSSNKVTISERNLIDAIRVHLVNENTVFAATPWRQTPRLVEVAAREHLAKNATIQGVRVLPTCLMNSIRESCAQEVSKLLNTSDDKRMEAARSLVNRVPGSRLFQLYLQALPKETLEDNQQWIIPIREGASHAFILLHCRPGKALEIHAYGSPAFNLQNYISPEAIQTDLKVSSVAIMPVQPVSTYSSSAVVSTLIRTLSNNVGEPTPIITEWNEEVESRIRRSLSNTLLTQRQLFLSGSMPSEMLSGTEGDSWLDLDHVDNSIRTFVEGHEGLRTTSVFPTLDVADIERICANSLCEYEEAIQPTFTPLPERSTVSAPDVLSAINQEEAARIDFHDSRGRAASLKVRQNNNQARLFEVFLRSMQERAELWQPHNSPQLDRETPKQWVIPIRINQNHYTGLVVHFTSSTQAHVQYYNSSGAGIPEYIRQGIIGYLNSRGITYATYHCASVHEQIMEGNNCGVFVFRNAIRLLAENLKIENPLSEWIPQDSTALTKEYNQAIDNYRSLMATLCHEKGASIAIGGKLKTKVEKEQEAFEKDRFNKILALRQALLNELNKKIGEKAPATDIQILQTKIQAFDDVVRNRPVQSVPLPVHQSFLRRVIARFSSLSLAQKSGLILGLMVSGYFGIYHGAMLLSWLTMNGAGYLPANPLIAWGLGAISIVGGYFAFYGVDSYFSEDASTASQLRPLSVAAPSTSSSSTPGSPAPTQVLISTNTDTKPDEQPTSGPTPVQDDTVTPPSEAPKPTTPVDSTSTQDDEPTLPTEPAPPVVLFNKGANKATTRQKRATTEQTPAPSTRTTRSQTALKKQRR